MTETILNSAVAEVELKRYPIQKKELLRAWDAADELLLQYVQDENLLAEGARLLILNDAFGALSVSLAAHRPVNRQDSYVSQFSCQQNAKLNNLSIDAIDYLSSLSDLQGDYDVVLVKVPKTLAYLQDQLQRIRPHLHENSRVVGAGMVKYLHSSTLSVFEKTIGQTTTSLAKKKARLIFAEVTAMSEQPLSPALQWAVPEYDLTTVNMANVFSKEKLDIGARALLPYIPTEPVKRMIDLGCGNGVLGFRARQLHPEAHIVFIDESYMAVESAKKGYEANFGQDELSDFRVADGLSGFDARADLILCNPPFHQQQAVGDHIAWRMFQQSQRVLSSGGELMVVGNRHLNYHIKLKRLFSKVTVVADNKKFVVWSCLRT